ncbi:MAG: hypothetical protein EBY83_08495 [Verrucomicrobia bacterium]|nr:hypothetical protein [Verrucomicrobiota bacterium]
MTEACEARNVRIDADHRSGETHVGCDELQPSVFVVAALGVVTEFVHFQLNVHVFEDHQQVGSQ